MMEYFLEALNQVLVLEEDGKPSVCRLIIRLSGCLNFWKAL